jgi:hypothetical protein
MKLQLENPSKNDSAVNEIFQFAKNNTFEQTKLFVSIYHPGLMIGRGGNHIWIKDKKDIDTRLAIIFI